MAMQLFGGFTLRNPTKTGYTFIGWTGSNGTIPQTTVTIAQGSTGNREYTANWTQTITYTVHIQHPDNGTITVMNGNETVNDGAVLESGTVLTLTATPNTDYKFVKWWDGDTNPIREIILNSNLTISASFRSGETSIQNPVNENSVAIFPNPAQNFVYITADFHIERIEIFNASGIRALVEENPADKINLHGFIPGTYFVRIYGTGGMAVTKKLIVR